MQEYDRTRWPLAHGNASQFRKQLISEGRTAYFGWIRQGVQFKNVLTTVSPYTGMTIAETAMEAVEHFGRKRRRGKKK